MRALLHIGTEKTGTTSVQNFLLGNRAALGARGILIPASLGEKSHRRLPFMASHPDHIDEFTRQNRLLNREKRDAARAEFRAAFETELQGSPHERCIMLSEHLHSRLRSREEILALRDLLTPHFSDIRIVAYIRRQIDFATSLYSTGIKAGQTAQSIQLPHHSHSDYRALAMTWGGVFGLENLTLRLFERENLLGGNTVTDFCDVAGIAPDGLETPPSANISLDRLGLELLRRVNTKIPRFTNGGPNRLRADLKQYFETHFASGDRFTPPAEIVAAYEAYFAESNEWVRARFFPEREHLFDPVRPVRDLLLPYPEADLDRMADFIADIWLKKQKTIHVLREKVK